MSYKEIRAAAFATKETLEAARTALEEAHAAFEKAATAHGAAMGRLNDAKATERRTALESLQADSDTEYIKRHAARVARHIV